ncbi:hypothetical protein Ae201684P_007081 [Aphanomyces euteiches]|nr:hypothetical protein Ae201684P_007081 [Aphanomyces euteiches]
MSRDTTPSPIPFNVPEPDAAGKLLDDLQFFMRICSLNNTIELNEAQDTRAPHSSPPSRLRRAPESYKSPPQKDAIVCIVPHCSNAAQTRGVCKGHGGGSRCKIENCGKSSQSRGLCRRHGGGKRCSEEGCVKGVQRGRKCAAHGGVQPCSVEGCQRPLRGAGFCEIHRKDLVCKIDGCKRLGTGQDRICKAHQRQIQANSIQP